jgi:hypothetical protein
MMSDVLPFTAYDSMEYGSVNSMPPPPGFARRDLPQIQGGKPEPPSQMGQMPMQQGSQMQQGNQQPIPQGNQQGSNDEILRQIMTTDKEIELGNEPIKVKKADIGNYKNTNDIFFLLIAVLVVDVIVIFMVRFLPEVFGQNLNRWYDLFGLNAVIADVLIIVLGFVIARYVYTLYVKPKYGEGKWSPLMFTGVAVGTQLIHDLGFYYGIIQQVPRGQNMMIDVFKDYAASGGAKILFGDALLMIASSAVAMILKSQPMHIVSAVGLLTSYALPYILYTKNQYSVLK